MRFKKKKLYLVGTSSLSLLQSRDSSSVVDFWWLLCGQSCQFCFCSLNSDDPGASFDAAFCPLQCPCTLSLDQSQGFLAEILREGSVCIRLPLSWSPLRGSLLCWDFRAELPMGKADRSSAAETRKPSSLGGGSVFPTRDLSRLGR